MPNFTLNDDVFTAACNQFSTPFHLYDEGGIRRTARRLNAAFAWNPGFREYFAVKALPTPAILRLLGEEGCGLDCASYTELRLAQACGFTGEQIMSAVLDANVTTIIAAIVLLFFGTGSVQGFAVTLLLSVIASMPCLQRRKDAQCCPHCERLRW